MAILGFAFLLGSVSGLRTFTSVAAICWAARAGWFSLEHTRLAFLHAPSASYITSVLALGELVGDKLPATPSRTRFLPFFARILSGSFCGACMVMAGGAATTQRAPLLLIGPLAGAAGSILGTLAGASGRAMLSQAFGKDFPAAILEDALAIGLAATAVICRGRL